MDTYGHLFGGSDRDSADKMEQLFGNVPKERCGHNRPKESIVTRLADKIADKNDEVGRELGGISFILYGERGGNRTCNLLIKSRLLCQLSYAPTFVK